MRNLRLSEALCRLLEEIGAASGLEEACSTLDRRLRELLPFQSMAVFLPSDGSVRPVYATPGTLLPAGSAGPAVGEEIAAQVAATRRPVFQREPQSQPGGPAAGGNYGSVLAVPLDDRTEVVGVLLLSNREGNVFDANDLGALMWIREDLAHAIRRALRADAERFTESLIHLAAATEDGGPRPEVEASAPVPVSVRRGATASSDPPDVPR